MFMNSYVVRAHDKRVAWYDLDDKRYHFSVPGWWFDTRIQLEAASLIANSSCDDFNELKQLSVDKTPSKDDIIEACYWLTGGNVMWGQSSVNAITWKDAQEEVYRVFKPYLNDIIDKSETMYDLIVNLKKEKDTFYYLFYEDCENVYMSWDEYEEEQDDED